jgi:hypothetical protein
MNVSIRPKAAGDNDGGLTTTTVGRCLCHFIQQQKNKNTNDHGDGDDVDDLMSSRDSTLRCSICVQQILKPYRVRHQRALQEHESAKKELERRWEDISTTGDRTQRLADLHAESQRLRDQLASLRKDCGDMAVRVASKAVENEAHRESLGMNSDLERRKLHLQRLESGLLEGSMMHAIHQATDQVRVLRFQWARRVLAMHRLDIDPDDIKLTPLQKRRQQSQPAQQLQRRARGIAKIAGLPLPNAGPELYGVLPPMELQSALRLVAMVTSTVARCLGIVLPHPILLTLNSATSGDITDTVSEEELQRYRQQVGGLNGGESSGGSDRQDQNDLDQRFSRLHAHGFGSGGPSLTSSRYLPVEPTSSTASFLSLMDKSYWTTKAKKAIAKATGHEQSTETSAFIPPSTDATIVAQRLNHATAAILADDVSVSSNTSKFSLSTDTMNQDQFAIALQLLQNNVIVLCIRAGVPVAKLWPAEAMLLNLHELDEFCQKQTAAMLEH